MNIFLAFFTGFLVSIANSHVYHNISVNNYAECQLAHLYEEDFYFVETNTNKPIHTFFATGGVMYEYDIITTNATTLNMLYSLTCTRFDHKLKQRPKVAFIIDAGGLNQQNILPITYYEAKSSYEITVGVGEIFYFYFPS